MPFTSLCPTRRAIGDPYALLSEYVGLHITFIHFSLSWACLPGKWKYPEMFEPRIRDHVSLESWGIQGAHITWSILIFSSNTPEYPLLRVIRRFPKTHTSTNFMGRLLMETICPLWRKRLKTVFNIIWCRWFSRVSKRSFIYFWGNSSS